MNGAVDLLVVVLYKAIAVRVVRGISDQTAADINTPMSIMIVKTSMPKSMPDVPFGRYENSKCFTGTLSETSSLDSSTSFCFRYKCVGEGLSTTPRVHLANTSSTCKYEGSLKPFGYKGYINCPDPLTFCTTSDSLLAQEVVWEEVNVLMVLGFVMIFPLEKITVSLKQDSNWIIITTLTLIIIIRDNGLVFFN